ncbi:MAG TPA: alpha-L-fucosidase [Phycisphaerales bacterium]|nr:alpha-L-fucosidase [Phycisphaerales bacterium]
MNVFRTDLAMPAVCALLGASTLLTGCAASRRPEPVAVTPALADALWDSSGCVDDDRGRWFRDAKFGTFIHFGPYSHLGGYYDGKGPYRPAEQIIGLGDRHAVIPPAVYREKVAGQFNPSKFDAKTWVSLMKKAGQKYVILTTKHHDGFCMFETQTTSHDIMEATPFKRDIVRELADECRRQGLAFCVYYSIGDWCAKEVQDPRFPDYKSYMEAQLKELLSNYGDIPMLWFDNYWYVDNQWTNDEAHARELYAFARSLRPQMLVNDRCGVGAASDHGDYATPENQLKGSLQSRYFEVVMTNTADDNWGWVKGAANYRPAQVLIRNLIDSTSKGGNFVLNVGPDADGEFPAEHVANLEKLGDWTSVNGQAIYATVPAPEVAVAPADGPVYYATKSRDGSSIFIHVISWPSDGSPLSIHIQGHRQMRCTPVDPSTGAVTMNQTHENQATILKITPPAKLDPYATVFRLSDVR